MLQSPFFRSRWLLIYSVNCLHWVETKCSLPCSQQPATCPYPKSYNSSPCLPILLVRSILVIFSYLRLSHECYFIQDFSSCCFKEIWVFSLYRTQRPCPCITFRNMLYLYCKEVLVPRPTPFPEDHTLSAVRVVYSIFSKVHPPPSIHNPRTCIAANLKFVPTNIHQVI